MWALYAREVYRFRQLFIDTVLGPIVSLGLYLVVFRIILNSNQFTAVDDLSFIYAGLLAMIVVNNSFSNPGFALVIAKNVGSIIDLHLVPIPHWQIGIGYALAALTRGVVTLGFATLCTVWFVPEMTLLHPLGFLVVVGVVGIEFGMLGVIFGMWAKDFSALTLMMTFILQPMVFLAGLFYPISRLPTPWPAISLLNPLFHHMNLFRYTLIGYTDAPVWISSIVILFLGIGLFLMMYWSTKKKIREA